MIELEPIKPKPKCHGLIFRCSMSAYPSSKGFAQHVEMVLQKRLSCRPDICPVHDEEHGTAACEDMWLENDLREDSFCWDGALPIDGVRISGAYYRVRIDGARDWETGHFEIDGYFFVPMLDTEGRPLNKSEVAERMSQGVKL